MSRTNRNHGNHWRQMEGWVLGTEISRRWEKWGKVECEREETWGRG